MADQGFIVNDAEVLAVGTSYATGKAILLHEDSTSDAKSKAMPQACYLSHLELQLDETSSTVSEVSCFLTWDSAGNDPITAEAVDLAVHAGLTDTSLRLVSVAMDVWIRSPATQTTAGKVYLWVECKTGDATLKIARLHWAVR
jgi:hypothetical protein|tara:strand:+ start:648 stop:1076 length:429 start_codon:yes stop_codon:yes gene_type:complete